MKKVIINYLFSLMFLVVLSFLTSIVISLIAFNKDININKIIIIVISFLVFIGTGIFFGFLNKKQGLLRGIILALIYGLMVAIFYLFIDKINADNSTYIISIAKAFALIFGSIIGVNLRSKKLH